MLIKVLAESAVSEDFKEHGLVYILRPKTKIIFDFGQ